MITAPHFSILPSATDFDRRAARASPPLRRRNPTATFQPGVVLPEHEQDPIPAPPPTSMPTTEQVTSLRYASMAQAVRRLIGGQAKPI